MNGIQKATLNLSRMVARNSPTILTGLGVAGLVTTTVMGIRATPKAILILEKEGVMHNAREKDIPKLELIKEAVKLTWRIYLPTVLMGGATIACIVSANSINLRRNAALASLYTLTEATLKEYQSQVVKTIGEKKEQKIREEVYKEKIRKNPVTVDNVIDTGMGDTLFFDPTSGRYFTSDIEYVRRQVRNELNDLLIKDTFVPLNEFYYLLKLKQTTLGEDYGWDYDGGLLEFKPTAILADDCRPCLAIEFNIEPRYNFKDY